MAQGEWEKSIDLGVEAMENMAQTLRLMLELLKSLDKRVRELEARVA